MLFADLDCESLSHTGSFRPTSRLPIDISQLLNSEDNGILDLDSDCCGLSVQNLRMLLQIPFVNWLRTWNLFLAQIWTVEPITKIKNLDLRFHFKKYEQIPIDLDSIIYDSICVLVTKKHTVGLPKSHCTVGWNCAKSTHSIHRHEPLAHELRSEWVSERANEWAQRSAWA